MLATCTQIRDHLAYLRLDQPGLRRHQLRGDAPNRLGKRPTDGESNMGSTAFR